MCQEVQKSRSLKVVSEKGAAFQQVTAFFVSSKRALRLFKACTMFCGSPESVRHSPLSTEMDVTTPGLPKACGAVSPKHAHAKRLNIQSNHVLPAERVV